MQCNHLQSTLLDIHKELQGEFQILKSEGHFDGSEKKIICLLIKRLLKLYWAVVGLTENRSHSILI